MSPLGLQRGEVYRVNLEPTTGREQQGDARPCVILSISPFNVARGTVVVIPLSSNGRDLPPFYVSVPSGGKETSTALVDQIRAIDKSRIVPRCVGTLSSLDMAKIERALAQVIGL